LSAIAGCDAAALPGARDESITVVATDPVAAMTREPEDSSEIIANTAVYKAAKMAALHLTIPPLARERLYKEPKYEGALYCYDDAIFAKPCV
jgi:hypothetical protein